MKLLRTWLRTRRADARPSEGCGYWIVASVASLLMLCVNLAIVQVALVAIVPLAPRMMSEPRVQQAALLIAPPLMVFIEWWLWEAIVEWFLREKPAAEKTRRR